MRNRKQFQVAKLSFSKFERESAIMITDVIQNSILFAHISNDGPAT